MVGRCRRIQSLVYQGDLSGLVPSQVLEDIFVEAVDVFCALIAKAEHRKTLMQLIGTQFFALPAEKILHYFEMHKPTVRPSPTVLAVGRVSLPLTTAKVHPHALFDKTRASRGVYGRVSV